MSTTTTRPQTAKAAVPRCDLCLQKDGWKGLCLQKCHSCGVCIHEQCYGLIPSDSKNQDFECWACQAVGTQVEGRALRGKCHKITVKERPVECSLCSFSGGMHAMHPLYHAAGPEGRQVILPACSERGLPQRLAWVHSLCAFGVCGHRGTAGCVYGCDKDGVWQGDETLSDEEEQNDEAEGEDVADTHHFVMCGLDGVKDGHSRVLADHRQLMCTICGNRDTSAWSYRFGHSDTSAGRSLRVPLQCCAGDKDEYEEFKRHHCTVGDACTQAMHVGCAMWGTKGVLPPHRRMWFFPGCIKEVQDIETQDPVVEIFCDLHANQLGASSTNMRKRRVDKQAGILKRTAAESSLMQSKETTATRRGPSEALATKKAAAGGLPGLSKQTREATLKRKGEALKEGKSNKMRVPKKSDVVQKCSSFPATAPSLAHEASDPGHKVTEAPPKKKSAFSEILTLTTVNLPRKATPLQKDSLTSTAPSVARPANNPSMAAVSTMQASDHAFPEETAGQRHMNRPSENQIVPTRLRNVSNGKTTRTAPVAGLQFSQPSMQDPGSPTTLPLSPTISDESPNGVMSLANIQGTTVFVETAPLSEIARQGEDAGLRDVLQSPPPNLRHGEVGVVDELAEDEDELSEGETPEGENPWAYLWEENAPMFNSIQFQYVSQIVRRDVDWVVASLFPNTEKNTSRPMSDGGASC